MSEFLVYLIHNTINGKIYVGYTSMKFKDRWYSHCSSASDLQDTRRFIRAIRKYGSSAFVYEILNSVYLLEEAKRLETLWICTLRSYDHEVGYNMTYGGEGIVGYRHSEETKRTISASSVKSNSSRIGKSAVEIFGEDRARNMALRCKEGTKLYFSSLSDEQKTENSRKISEAIKKSWDTRREAFARGEIDTLFNFKPWKDRTEDEQKTISALISNGVKNYYKNADEQERNHRAELSRTNFILATKAQKSFWSSLTPEERSIEGKRRASSQWGHLTKEQRSAEARRRYELRQHNKAVQLANREHSQANDGLQAESY